MTVGTSCEDLSGTKMAVNKRSLENLKPIQKGETRNPGGKPVGARDRITKKFLYDLAESFERNGAAAIQRLYEEDVAAYVKVAAALVPKEVNLEVKHSFTDILKHLEHERRAAEAADRAVGTGVAEVGQERAPVRH
jgi:hypothetical protein